MENSALLPAPALEETTTESRLRTCALPTCGKPVPDDRGKYCCNLCLVKATIAQDNKKAGTKVFKQVFSERKCESCKSGFLPSTPRSKYCGDECKAKGLLKILEARKREREATKKRRKEVAEAEYELSLDVCPDCSAAPCCCGEPFLKFG